MNLTADFKTWTEARKVKDSDLLFRRALKSHLQKALFLKLADHLATLNPSFSEGVQTLELLTDLILMGHDEDLFEDSLGFSSWQKNLKQLRYPETTARDDQLKHKLEKLPWPYGAKIKFERRGDRAGVELKLFVSSPTDLTKILASLERVQQEFTP
jgi:hypothetical protein